MFAIEPSDVGDEWFRRMDARLGAIDERWPMGQGHGERRFYEQLMATFDTSVSDALRSAEPLAELRAMGLVDVAAALADLLA
jgi:hypothetical protein